MTTALPNVPIGTPATITAGDTVVWDILTIADPRGPFPSATWALSYSFVAQASKLALPGAALTDGTGWRVTMTATESKSLANPDATGPEAVSWLARVTSGSETFSVMSGRLSLYPDNASAAGSLSQEERELALLDAAALSLASGNIIEYSVQGRTVRKENMVALNRRRGELRYLIDQQRYPGSFGRGIEFHMRAPR